MKVSVASYNETVLFAASELRKYLKMMFPDQNTELGSFSEAIFVGTLDEAKISVDGRDDGYDLIYIKTEGERGYICGNSERATLLAVYEFLRRQGCRFLFPGLDGEFIPTPAALTDVSLTKKAPCKISGQCIEGSVSIENVLAAIDFAPKVGLNSYMLECYSPFGYMNGWYSHRKNEFKRNENLSLDTAIQWKRLCEAEIAKRGLSYHDMGHGWTTLAFDMNPDTNEICEENLQYLAEINGTRGLFRGEAINTNFCMSSEGAKKKFVNYVVNYAKNHSNVDFLHLWLADGKNNHCECAECQKYIPSELYVGLMNALDEAFTRENLKTKIVFICYGDLFFPPIQNRIKNSDRFYLLFAPFTRDYLTNYGSEPDFSGVQKYERNKLQSPQKLEQCLAYLDNWRNKFDGDVFCYEYHFQAVCFKDFGGIWTAKCAYDDARGIKKNKIAGIIEDQTQRSAYPSGLGVYAWARAMSDEDLTFEDIVSDYFSHAYGADWKSAYEFLCDVSDAFSKEYMLGCFCKGQNLYSPEMQERMIKIKERAESFKAVCEENLIVRERCQSVSWQLLRFHCDFCIRVADVFYEFAGMKFDTATAELKKLNTFLAENEDLYQKYFDLGLFIITMELYFDKAKKMNPQQ